MEVTLDFAFYEHSHENDFVGRVETTGTTSSGHVVVGGHDNIQENDDVEIYGIKDVWRNHVDGSMYETTLKITIGAPTSEVDGMVVDGFGLRCIGAPTILP
jgi:hypothetical protein